MTRLFPIVLFLLASCATTPPLPSEGVDTALTPEQAAEAGMEARGSRVLWGGVIIASSHLKERTRLEVLAYPLGSGQRPVSSRQAGHRFIAYYRGFLESVDYAAGREVSMVGTISGLEEGTVGAHPYRYPTIEAEQLHLWPLPKPEREPRFQFGIGVILHN